jgi:hypothetical protein
MAAGFFSGSGPDRYIFGPGTAISQVMGQSGPVQSVLDEYYMTGQTNGLYTFDAPDLVSTGVNPVAQFVGSITWNISNNILIMFNRTSFKSLTYESGPAWNRGIVPFPMGNIFQTFQIHIICH